MRIYNRTHRVLTFNLDSPYFLQRNGGRPDALTLAALERRTVPDEVRDCREVGAAIRRDELRVLQEPSPTVAEMTPKATTTTDEETPQPPKRGRRR